MQAALDRVWPYVEEIFDGRADTVAASCPASPSILPTCVRPGPTYVENVIAAATLTVPTPNWRSRGGRTGYHTENLGHLLPEMQNLHRVAPRSNLVTSVDASPTQRGTAAG